MTSMLTGINENGSGSVVAPGSLISSNFKKVNWSALVTSSLLAEFDNVGIFLGQTKKVGFYFGKPKNRNMVISISSKSSIMPEKNCNLNINETQ